MRLVTSSLVALCAALGVSGANAAQLTAPGYEVPVVAGPHGPVATVVPADAGIYAKRRTANFQVTYNGFSKQAKQAFQRAVDIWATKVSSPVTIKVQANWKPLDPGVLGSAGPQTIHGCTKKCVKGMKPNVWYPAAIANKLSKKDLDSGTADIVANFSSAYPNWHFGSGNAPNGEYDFTSVVLHELGHGLGFVGAANVQGDQGTVRLSGYPLVYTISTVDSKNKKLTSFPDPSNKLKKVLTSGKVFFKAGKKKYKLYAPPTWEGGSSFSHLDEQTYKRGNKNSLMTPAISDGETIRNPGPITMKIFDVMGW